MQKLKNNEARTKFSGSYKKKRVLKATYLIALLHISNENTAYLFEICRYIKYFERKTKHLLCGIKGVRLLSYSSQTRSGTPPPFFSLSLLNSLMKGNNDMDKV